MNLSAKLFYIVQDAEDTFSIYSLKNDREILSSVSQDLASIFLMMNEPEHPFLMLYNYDADNLDVDLNSLDLIINNLSDSAYKKRPNPAINRVSEMEEQERCATHTISGINLQNNYCDTNLSIIDSPINWCEVKNITIDSIYDIYNIIEDK